MPHLSVSLLVLIAMGTLFHASPALGQGKPAFPSIEAAVQALSADEFETRQQASSFLWEAGKSAQPALEEAAKSPDAEVRHRALMVLRKVRLGITPDTPAEIQTLITQFHDGNLDARQRVINELRRMQAYDMLFGLLQSENDPASRQLFYNTLQMDIQRLAPQMIVAKDWSILEQWLDLGKHTDAGLGPYVAYALLRERLPEEIKKAHSEHQKNGDAGSALRLAALLRAQGEGTQALTVATSIDAPKNAWVQGLAREQRDWLRFADLHGEKATAPRMELYRLAIRGTAYRLANKQAEAEAEFEQIKTLAPGEDVWFGAKSLLLNDRPVEAIELLQPGLKPMAFDLLVQRQEHQAALDLVGITDNTRFDAKWFASLSNQQGVRTSRTVDRFAFAVTIAAELRTLGKQKQFDELYALLETTAASEASRGQYWQQLARLERQPGRQKKMLELYGRGAATNHQSVLSALFRTKLARAQTWWEALDGPLWQSPATRLAAVAVALQPETYARHVDVRWDSVAEYVARKADSDRFDPPIRAKYHIALAEAWAVRNDKRGADTHWQAACALDPSARLSYADSLLAEQRWLEAAAQYQRSVEAKRASFLGWYLQGTALTRAGREDLGAPLQTTANLMCLDSTSRYSLAMALQERNLKEEAQKQWRLLQQTSHPDNPTVTLANQHLGNAAAEKDPLTAADHWEQLRFHLLKPTSNLVEQTGYLELAISIHRARARGLLAKGDKPGALEALRICQELVPGYIKVVEEFAPLLRQAGLPDEANKLFENSFKIYSEAAGQFPESATLANNAAWVAAITGNRLDEALVLAKRAVQLAPDSAAYADTMAEVFFVRGDREQALVWARKAVELDPESKFYAERLEEFAKRELPKK
jgi:tetratricopeptide (TPR) repeat protein